MFKIKLNKDNFKIKYNCYECNAEMTKKGSKNFKNVYKVICPFCGGNMWPSYLRGWKGGKSEQKTV